MIPYITFRENNEDGLLCYYILQKAFPHYVGLIATGILENTLSYAPVAGYNLYVNFKGTLRGNLIPNYKDVLQEIGIEMSNMAEWFYYNRVITEPKKYLRFKIQIT